METVYVSDSKYFDQQHFWTCLSISRFPGPYLDSGGVWYPMNTVVMHLDLKKNTVLFRFYIHQYNVAYRACGHPEWSRDYIERDTAVIHKDIGLPRWMNWLQYRISINVDCWFTVNETSVDLRGACARWTSSLPFAFSCDRWSLLILLVAWCNLINGSIV